MQSGWQLSGDAPTTYTRFAHKIMEPWTDDLIHSAGCRDGDRVLDVACGAGLVANRLNLVTGKLCWITGIDVNEGMLNVARRNSQIEWHQGSAIELPFADGSFDVVLCQQGLQYFPDRPAAIKEIGFLLRVVVYPLMSGALWTADRFSLRWSPQSARFSDQRSKPPSI